jgi:hypothetical protein
MKKFTFSLKLVKGNLEEWKKFNPEKVDELKGYNGKNLEYRFEGDIKIVSVEYESIVDLLNGIMRVESFFQSHGFHQEVIKFLSPQSLNILKELKEMKEVFHA